jgi:uncharacterized protein
MFDKSNPTHQKSSKPTIAIIGTGISGLSAAYMLCKDYEITVYEKATAPGGHSHSVNVGSQAVPLFVDMGFIVFNAPSYPNLIALFDHLGVKHELSDMSFAVSMDKGDFEYASSSPKALLAQKRNILRPRFLRLLLDIVRFYKQAPKHVTKDLADSYSLGQYLKDYGYSKSFIDDHLLPQAAAIWSTSALQVMDYPFRAFMAFFDNHGLLELNIKKRILWRTVTGGSQAYVKALTAPFAERIITGTPVVSVERHSDGVMADKVRVTDAKGETKSFDQVIFASHADESLAMLKDASPQEREILSAFAYTENQVVLHTDKNLMPKRKAAWSSWNYLGEKLGGEKLGREKKGHQDAALCVTYWMNLLQNLKSDTDYFVTLNPIKAIEPAKIIKTVCFEHPLFDARALAAQSQFKAIQGQNRAWFCGAYLGSGFHEDGLQSGLLVAEALSGKARPWAFDLKHSRLRWLPDARTEAQAAQ